MTNTARETILSNLCAASPAREYAASDFSIIEDKILNSREKIAKYKEVTQAVNTEVHELERTNWIEELEKFLNDRGIRHLMYGPNSDLGKKLEADWDKTGTQLLPYDRAMEECKDDLFNVDAAITRHAGCCG